MSKKIPRRKPRGYDWHAHSQRFCEAVIRRSGGALTLAGAAGATSKYITLHPGALARYEATIIEEALVDAITTFALREARS